MMVGEPSQLGHGQARGDIKFIYTMEWRRAGRWMEVEEVEDRWWMGNGRGGAMVGPLIGFLFSIVAPQGLAEGMVVLWFL